MKSNLPLFKRFYQSLFLCCLLINNVIAKDDFSAIYTTDSKVVAIGDIHGAYSRFQQLLIELQLIDKNNQWIGGDTYLISLGDLLDRGADSRKVIDLVINLQKQAPNHGGKVLQVLGNHELMVTTGDLRYVSVEEFSAFKQDENKTEREQLFKIFTKNNPQLSSEQVTEQFNQQYPPGYLGFVDAFSPSGKYGRWLRKAMPVIKVNDSLFAHGGFSSQTHEKSIEELNEIMLPVWEYQDIVDKFHNENVLSKGEDYWSRVEYLNHKIKPFIEQSNKAQKNKRKTKNNIIPQWYNDFVKLFELQSSFAFSEESPMWYRGNAYCHPYSESFNTERTLKQLNAKRIVIGHSPQHKNIKSRFNEQVFLADTGMLETVYRGNATALIIENENVLVHKLGSETGKNVEAELDKFSVGSDQFTDEMLEDILSTGTVTDMQGIGVGVTKSSVITLEKNGQTIRAIFKTFDSDPKIESRFKYTLPKQYVPDRYKNEIAAYRLDRLLGLNQIAVAIEREIDGEVGLVQYWIEDLMHEKEREEKKLEFNSYCPKIEQYRTRIIFDTLVYNDDRNQTNLTFSKKDNMLYLIDHSIAFSLMDKAPSMYKKSQFRLSSLFREKLEKLTFEQLQQELSGLLHKKQIAAIITRRDKILTDALVP